MSRCARGLTITRWLALVVIGTYQAWRGVGSWAALVETTCGRLLPAKIAGMCMLIALAAQATAD